MTDTPQVLLQHHLKKLRLPTFLGEYSKLAQQCAAEKKDHVQYLLRLCELELIERERRMIERRIHCLTGDACIAEKEGREVSSHQEPPLSGMLRMPCRAADQLRFQGDPVTQQAARAGAGVL